LLDKLKFCVKIDDIISIRPCKGDLKMRKMRGKSLGEDGVCTVVEHIILKNMWEYYILKTDLDEDDDKWKTALVVGDYTEIGGVSMPEIEPYIVSRTTDLRELIPAPDWEWVTDSEANAFLYPEELK